MGKLYAGIDLHSNNNYLCIIDESDKRLVEVTLENNPRAVLLALSPFPLRVPDAITRRGIKIADPQIQRMFDGGQPVLIAVLMEGGTTQPDEADRLPCTPEGALFHCPCHRNSSNWFRPVSCTSDRRWRGKTTIWFPSGSLNQRAGLVGWAEWTAMPLRSR